MKNTLSVCLALGFLCASAGTNGQTASQPTGPAWRVSALMDAYYSVNFNRPASRLNQLRNFDLAANRFDLSLAKFSLERTARPVGFRVDAGFGRTFELMHASLGAGSAFRYLQQAYLIYRPVEEKDLEIDIGQHVTMAGAEVIESPDNWNYSRSLLFSLAIPYYHLGLRARLPLGEGMTAWVHFSNGWNNALETSPGKTVGGTLILRHGSFTWTQNYYGGIELAGSGEGWRHLYDTNLTGAWEKLSFYLNSDYGVQRNARPAASVWYGVAGALRWSVRDGLAVAGRAEWFRDRDGFATGVPQLLRECTLTLDYRLTPGHHARLEYRRDWSNVAFFERGTSAGPSRSQNTLVVGWTATFSWPQ